LRGPGHRDDIDGLRGVAVLLVIGFHFAPGVFPGGFAGVDVFFVISGFVIARLLERELEQTGHLSVVHFYRRRVQRLFPALLAVLLTGLALGYFVLFYAEYRELAKHAAAGAAFVANAAQFVESGYFDPAGDTKPLRHLWSLAVEEQFYLLFPAVMLLGKRNIRWRRGLVVGLLAVSFLLAQRIAGHDRAHAFFLPHTRVWELLLGATAALFGIGAANEQLPAAIRLSGPIRTSLSLGGLLTVLGSALVFDGQSVWPGVATLLPTCGTLALIVAGEDAIANRGLLASRLLVGVGRISYGLYLWHWLLLSFVTIMGSGTPRGEFVLGALLSTFALSALSYRFVESPLRYGRQRRLTPVLLVGSMLAVGSIGYGVYAAGGLPKRAIDRRAPEDLSWRYQQELRNNCAALFGMDPGVRHCVANDPAPTLAFVGDSHAMVAFEPVFRKRLSARALLLAQPGCVPFAGYDVVHETGTDLRCDASARGALELIERTKSIRHVLIVERPTRWLAAKLSDGVLTTDTGYTVRPLGTRIESPAQFYRDGLDQTLSRVEALGRTPILVLDNPELRISPSRCEERPLSLSSQRALSPCGKPRSVVEEQERGHLAVVAQLQARHPRLAVFDGRWTLCDARYCYARDRDHIFYRDGNHLTVTGAERTFAPLLAMLAGGRLP